MQFRGRNCENLASLIGEFSRATLQMWLFYSNGLSFSQLPDRLQSRRISEPHQAPRPILPQNSLEQCTSWSDLMISASQ
jgi:hypothetical protein